MTVFVINFSDPIKTGFNLSGGTFDGPGSSNFPITAVTTGLHGTFSVVGNFTATFVPSLIFNVVNSTGNNETWTVLSSSLVSGNTVITVTGTVPSGVADGTITLAHTSLRLYGQGSVNWGEGFDENILRLTENFSGATPPIIPIEGQLWYSVKLYWHNTVLNKWWRWNYSTSTWDNITNPIDPAYTTQKVNSVQPVLPNLGDYWFDGTTLRRWDSAYQQIPATWMVRYFSVSTVDPVNGTDIPPHQLLSWNGNMWSGAAGITAQATPPSGPQIGQLWYDTSVNLLKVWDGSTWAIVGGVTSFNGRMGVVTLTSGDVTTALGYTPVNKAGDTMTGLLVLSGDPVVALGAATKQYVVAKAGDTMTGLLVLSGDPVVALGAATKQYTDASRLILENSQSVDYTLVLSDANKLITLTGATPHTFTVPLNASVAFPLGTKITFSQDGTGALTIAAAGGVTIKTESSLTLHGQNATSSMIKVGTDTWRYTENELWQGAHKIVSTGAPSGGVDGDVWFRYV